jgi:hypothetical protein
MARQKYVESNIPADCRLSVVQIAVDGLYIQKRGTDNYIPVNYITQASLYRNGKLVGRGLAKSTEKAPSRKTGRMIAVGRAVKEYYTKHHV